MWKDQETKRPVITVTSKHSNSMIDVTTKCGKVTTKLTLIHQYYQSMNVCNHLDQFVSYWTNLHQKTVKFLIMR